MIRITISVLSVWCTVLLQYVQTFSNTPLVFPRYFWEQIDYNPKDTIIYIQQIVYMYIRPYSVRPIKRISGY